MFPTSWKESEVVPLLKEGDYDTPNDNRPVSMCDRATFNQLTEYMTRRNFLTEHQHVNKKQHSTGSLSIFMSNMVLEAIDRKQITALVLLDLSKAFDSIDHKILLTVSLPRVPLIDFTVSNAKRFFSVVNGEPHGGERVNNS